MYYFEYTYACLLITYVHKTYIFEVSHQILSNMCARIPRTYMHAFQEHICTFSFSSNSLKHMCMSSKNIHARLSRTYMYFQFHIKFVKTYVHVFQKHTCTPSKNIYVLPVSHQILLSICVRLQRTHFHA